MEPNASATKPSAVPRILLVEDDAASAAFLGQAVAACGCAVDARVDGAAALAAARRLRYDLLLIDRRLPDMDAAGLLHQLRAEPVARSRTTPALATSAEWTAQRRARALAAGYLETIDKPCDAATLQRLLERHLPWDAWPARSDAAARNALGTAANVVALRRLFARELQGWEEALAAPPPPVTERCEALHRLCAAAGFCGAPALAAAARAWLAALRGGTDAAPAAATFRAALTQARKAFPEPD